MTRVLVGRTERSRVWRASKVAVQILSAHPWRRPHTGLFGQNSISHRHHWISGPDFILTDGGKPLVRTHASDRNPSKYPYPWPIERYRRLHPESRSSARFSEWLADEIERSAWYVCGREVFRGLTLSVLESGEVDEQSGSSIGKNRLQNPEFYVPKPVLSETHLRGSRRNTASSMS
jgi:hypothetical protein